MCCSRPMNQIAAYQLVCAWRGLGNNSSPAHSAVSRLWASQLMSAWRDSRLSAYELMWVGQLCATGGLASIACPLICIWAHTLKISLSVHEPAFLISAHSAWGVKRKNVLAGKNRLEGGHLNDLMDNTCRWQGGPFRSGPAWNGAW